MDHSWDAAHMVTRAHVHPEDWARWWYTWAAQAETAPWSRPRHWITGCTLPRLHAGGSRGLLSPTTARPCLMVQCPGSRVIASPVCRGMRMRPPAPAHGAPARATLPGPAAPPPGANIRKKNRRFEQKMVYYWLTFFFVNRFD